jgi:hypothetical protein
MTPLPLNEPLRATCLPASLSVMCAPVSPRTSARWRPDVSAATNMPQPPAWLPTMLAALPELE